MFYRRPLKTPQSSEVYRLAWEDRGFLLSDSRGCRLKLSDMLVRYLYPSLTQGLLSVNVSAEMEFKNGGDEISNIVLRVH